MPSTLNCTAPVGVEVPLVATTVAVNVTDWPKVEGFGEDASDVVVPVTPAPLSEMVCAAFVRFKLLSVKISDPVSEPTAVGLKLTGNRQLAPAARVPEEESVVKSGHAAVPLLFSAKFAEMDGLLPLVGTASVRGALPMLATVTVCGLSLLVEPTTVDAKVRLGGVAKFSL